MSKKIEVELSTCCDAVVVGSYPVCTRCHNSCTTYLTMEEFYDEIAADDERGMSDEEINNSLDELT